MMKCLFVILAASAICLLISPTIPRCMAFDSPIRWVAFGESITIGYGASPGHSFISLLEREVGTIDNRAIGGTRAVEQVQRMLEYSGPASNVIWLAGYLDARNFTPLEDYKNTLRSGIAEMQRRGNRVYLGTCLRMWDSTYDSSVADVIDTQRQVAAEFPNVIVAEASALYDPQEVIADTVHPNDAGHAQIAKAFLSSIRPHMIFLPYVYR